MFTTVNCSITLFLYKNKSLGLDKKFKNKARLAVPQNTRTKCLSKIIRTEHQNRSWLSLIMYYRLVLLSHCNITKLFNGHILFQEYTPFKFVCIHIGLSSFTFLLHEY